VFWLLLGDVLSPRAMAIGVALINMVGQLGSFALSSLWGVVHDATGGYGAGVAALPFGYVACAAIILALRRRARPTGAPPVAMVPGRP
jgi:nitrate/nitrite transporter NarK